MSTLSKHRTILELAVVLVLVGLLLAPVTASARPPAHDSHGLDQAALLNQAMRKLWEDHITWTRLVIVSFDAGLPDLNAAVTRLLQNQTDIGNAIKPFYGDAVGNRLTALLRDHILIAADLLADAKSGNSAKFNADNALWYANADDIATFLHNANPKHWPLPEMRRMMRRHLDLTLAEATARLKGDWTGDVAAYDAVHQEILDMADMLSTGIVEQFPDRFER
ncbi:MAG TPA: hypothetical protein VGA61_18410 [Anaerolineae bacterium]